MPQKLANFIDRLTSASEFPPHLTDVGTLRCEMVVMAELMFLFAENVVASAATNGVIITWDLNKPGRNKQGLSLARCSVISSLNVSKCFSRLSTWYQLAL